MNGVDAPIARPARSAVAPAVVELHFQTWTRVSLMAALAITFLDGALLQRKHGLFTGGFLASLQFGTIIDGLAFLMLAGLLNFTIVLPLALATLSLGRRLGLRPVALLFAAFSLSALPLVVANFVIYKVWSYLGDAFDFNVMTTLAGWRFSEVLAVATPIATGPLFQVFLGLGCLVPLTAWLHRLDRRHPGTTQVPEVRPALRRCAAFAVTSALLVTAIAMNSEAMTFAFRWTPSGQLFTIVLNRLTDFDGDHYGLVRSPRDSAPFNASIHPYAVDLPGNGVDENGLAGDLPLDTGPPSRRSESVAPWTDRPPVILFLLESVRADAVGARRQGRAVTPTLDALAAEGLRVPSAWSHAGSTAQSRYHLLTGSLFDGRGSNTLLDDFKSQGYEVAYFSGQDDEFGSVGLTFSGVDKFYDARQDVSRRYSASTTPGSLAVPLTVLQERITEYLQGRTARRPLFLYVNFHDTHYPYDHTGLDNLLGGERLPASLISPSRRPDLTVTYLNAVANVDRAIGSVIRSVETHSGRRPAVIVVSDHGESLFEQGVLGHGFALNDAQTRVPLIIRGLPVRVPTPVGLADLRATVTEAMTRDLGEIPRTLPPSRSARVFQYLGTPDTPGQIGWRTVDGWLTYDFRTERVALWNSYVSPKSLVGEPARDFTDLVHTWERMLLTRLGLGLEP